MRWGRGWVRTGLLGAAVAALIGLIAACGPSASDSAEGGSEDGIPTETLVGAPPAEVLDAASGDASRCQPVSGGPPPIFAELQTYTLQLGQKVREGSISREDYDAVNQELQQIFVELGNQNFDQACALTDALRAEYGF